MTGFLSEEFVTILVLVEMSLQYIKRTEAILNGTVTILVLVEMSLQFSSAMLSEFDVIIVQKSQSLF